MTRKKTVLSVRKAAGYFCGGSVPKFKTDSWFPLRGIAAKTAMAARAVPSAAEPRIQHKPKERRTEKDLLGKASYGN